MSISMTHGKLIDLLKKQKPTVMVYMSLGFVEAKRKDIIERLAKYNPHSLCVVEVDKDMVLLR